MIRNIDRNEVKNLFPFLKNYKYKFLRWIRGIDENKLSEYHLFRISEILRKKKNFVAVYENKNEIEGVISFSYLPWDSKYFGYGVGKIDYFISVGDYQKQVKIKKKLLSHLFEEAEKRKIKFLNFRIDTQEISSVHTLEEKGAHLTVSELMFAWYREKEKSYGFEISPVPCKVRKFKKDDLPILLSFAKYFTTNRFYQDFLIPQDKALGIYTNWIKNACLNKFSGKDEVLVGEKDGKIIGFTTTYYDLTPKKFLGIGFGIPGLVSVLPEYRGRGINPYLIGCAISSLFKRVEVVFAPTHITNLNMLRSETKVGAELVETTYIFHKWL
jgi:GNAT superfamily N-acetyltransferase